MELVSIYTESHGQIHSPAFHISQVGKTCKRSAKVRALLPSRDAIHNRQFVSSILSMNLMLCKYYGLQK